MLPPGLFIADAHEDLAWHCQENARDLVDPGGVPCMVTLPWLIATGVRLICATFFTLHTRPPAERRELLEAQWRMYEGWFSQYPQAFRLVRNRRELADIASAEEVELAGVRGHSVGVILLMEGCELLDGPADLARWHSRGLRLASLTWNGVNQFASGTFGDDSGLTSAGRELLAEFRRLGIVLDLSHLADHGVEDVLSYYDGPLCATHSNARALADSPRNMPDAQLAEVGRRGGVIGLNLLASFIRTGWREGDPLPPLSEALDHVEHIAGIAGAGHVGLGSDLDGGLTPANTPEGIGTICDLPAILDGLAGRDWDETRLAGFAGGDWRRFFELHLPA